MSLPPPPPGFGPPSAPPPIPPRRSGAPGGSRRPQVDLGAHLRILARRYATAVAVVVAIVLLAEFLPSARHAAAPAGSSGAAASGITPAIPPGTKGVTVGGVTCGPGVRQVPWSAYAPLCEPKWSGNNGGATSPGVTRTTITLTYREAASSEIQAIYSIVPESVIGTNQEAIATMQAYINVFNKNFELYGRHVVLKPYVGKGDFVSELNGQDQTGAQGDAVTAKSLGAFADSSVLDATPIYDQALAQQGVVGLSIFGGPDSEFQQSSPYMYSTSTVCSKSVAQTVQLVSRVLATSPTSFSGDPAMNGKVRKFGLIGTGTSQSEACNAQIVGELKATYGITVSPVISMALNGNTLQTEATSAAAQMKAAGVTTILCTTCDFFTPIFVTKAADAQKYYPEWIESDFLDALTGLQSSDQLANAEGFGMQALPKAQTEAYKVFRLGAPATEHIIPSFSYVYEPLLMFFDALQAAGPNLTPQTFHKGFRSLPPSLPGGMYGGWSFDPNSFDPNGSYGIVHWSNTTPSAVDGRPGAWLNCNGGQLYEYSGAPPQLPVGKELACSGSPPPSGAGTGGNASAKPSG